MTTNFEHAVDPAFECDRPEVDAGAAHTVATSLEQPLSSLDPHAALEPALLQGPELEAGTAPPAVAPVASARSSCVAEDELPLSAVELAQSQRAEPEAAPVPLAVGVIATLPFSVAVDEQELALDSDAAPELAPAAVASLSPSAEQPLATTDSYATLVPQCDADAAPPTAPVDDHFFTPSNSYAALALSPTYASLKPRRQYIFPSHSLTLEPGAIASGVPLGLGFPDATPAFLKATKVKDAHPHNIDVDAGSDEEDDITDSAATLLDTPSDGEPAGDDATSQVHDTALDETAPTWALAHKRPALEFWGNVVTAIVFTALAIVWTCFAAMPKLIEKVDDDGWTAFFQLEAGFVWSFVTLLWLQTYRRQHLWLVAFENMALVSSFVVGIGGYAALALGTQYVFARMTEAKEGGGELAAVAATASCNSSVSI
ncbi:hypothetical protein EXIGLDRAFT_728550 [Exidia glandulosa HHB12029]|uniref:Uncharacterized protein n=1 Tax=Exidia glandulosa HHB12029 TaxID=1314781 RepID=A0A165Q2V9_EXIGL|nr:hypothetical protein EXIGLDRAFT_728550 [Exidia glandulosa HHB12029]